MKNILAELYPPEETFIGNPRYRVDKPEMTVECCVPQSRGYMLRPMSYISAENYVRILSQASYLLGYYIIERGMLPLAVKPEEFLKAAVNLQLYYRNMAMTFHKVMSKGETFKMTLQLTDFKELKRLEDFILFTFANKRTVISGEMSFIYAPNAR
jgi:hypothetical protein